MDDYADRLDRAKAALDRLIAAKKAGSSLGAALESLREMLRATLQAGVSASAIATELKKVLNLSQTEATIRKAIRKVVAETTPSERRRSQSSRPAQARTGSTPAIPRRAIGSATRAVPPAASIPPVPPADPAARQQAGLPLGQAEETPDWLSQSPIRRVTDDR